MAAKHYEHQLMRKSWDGWWSLVEKTWKARVEKACQQKAQEVCMQLTNDYEARLESVSFGDSYGLTCIIQTKNNLSFSL